MPCYTITTVTLELKQADTAALKKALESLGLDPYVSSYNEQQINFRNGSYDRSTGKLTVRNEETGKAIKRAYSAELVQMQAKRFGWQVKKISENKYEIIKR